MTGEKLTLFFLLLLDDAVGVEEEEGEEWTERMDREGLFAAGLGDLEEEEEEEELEIDSSSSRAIKSAGEATEDEEADLRFRNEEVEDEDVFLCACFFVE